MVIFDARDYATDSKHKISRNELIRRLNAAHNANFRLKKRVAELTSQRKELRLANRKLTNIVNACGNCSARKEARNDDL